MARSQKELLDLTKKLVSIESVSGNTEGLQQAYDVILQMLLTCDKNVTIEHFSRDGIQSLLAYRGPQRPDNFRIMLNGHIDVVPGTPEQFKPYEKDGKLYGRGVSDMKAAAVIMTDLFCEYVDKVPYALGLQIVTDEESSGQRGTAYQISQGVRADFVICGEAGRTPGTYEISNDCKGMAVVELEFNGTAAHGAYLWRGENALLRSTQFTNELINRYPVPHEESEYTTINVSSISTNNQAQTKVPDHARVQLDIRFVNEDPNFRTPQHMAALFEEIDPGVRVSNIITFDAPFHSSPKNPLLQRLKKVAEKVEGHEFKFVRRHGTSDGRFYGNVGDQSCEFGIAGVGHHEDEEWITIEAFKLYHKTMHRYIAETVKSEAYNTNTVAYQSV